MSKKLINIVVAGATGYVGLDLIYILSKHPKVNISNLCAQKNIGKKISFFDKRIKKNLPKISRLKNEYELLWDQKSPTGYLNVMATIQKFVDQSISTNTSYNPEFYADNEIPLMDILGDIIYACKIGIKTLYYNNTFDMSGEVKFEDDKPLDQSVEDDFDDSCESCML